MAFRARGPNYGQAGEQWIFPVTGCLKQNGSHPSAAAVLDAKSQAATRLNPNAMTAPEPTCDFLIFMSISSWASTVLESGPRETFTDF
jgi:hypothetical protein